MLKIVDFGSAVHFDNSQFQSRKRIGTVRYFISKVILHRTRSIKKVL